MQQGLNNAALHAVLIPQICATIAEARQAGIPQLITFSGNRQGCADNVGAANCITALRQLAPIAEVAGITLLFEVLNGFDHPDYQADHTAFGVEVVRGVNSPAVKLLYDAYHMFRMGEDVLADLLGNLDIIGHIHLAQSPKRTAPLPGGPLDHAAFIPKVLAAGYQGYLGLEFCPQGDSAGRAGGVQPVYLFVGRVKRCIEID